MTFKSGKSGNPGGRPKVLLDDLPEGWVESALALYSIGGSDVEVRAQVFGGMSNDLWGRLLKEEKLFSETISRGRLLCEAWWMSQGREGLLLDKFNNGPYALHMKNRFGWGESVKVEGGDKPIKHEHSGGVQIYIPDNGRGTKAD